MRLSDREVQKYLDNVVRDRNIVFVIGSGRSGTSLLQRCMATAREPVYYWSENSLTEVFKQRRIIGKNLVLKRTYACHRLFSQIPSGIKVLNIVRNPSAVFTSRVRQQSGYYIKSDWWIAKYLAFKDLIRSHPAENLMTVRFEDLISNPNSLQSDIGKKLQIEFDLPFTRYTERNYLDHKIDEFTGEQRVWEAIDPTRANKSRTPQEQRQRMVELAEDLKPHLSNFCSEYGYEAY